MPKKVLQIAFTDLRHYSRHLAMMNYFPHDVWPRGALTSGQTVLISSCWHGLKETGSENTLKRRNGGGNRRTLPSNQQIFRPCQISNHYQERGTEQTTNCLLSPFISAIIIIMIIITINIVIFISNRRP